MNTPPDAQEHADAPERFAANVNSTEDHVKGSNCGRYYFRYSRILHIQQLTLLFSVKTTYGMATRYVTVWLRVTTRYNVPFLRTHNTSYVTSYGKTGGTLLDTAATHIPPLMATTYKHHARTSSTCATTYVTPWRALPYFARLERALPLTLLLPPAVTTYVTDGTFPHTFPLTASKHGVT